MKRLIKLIFVLAIIGAVLSGMSYAGAGIRAASFVGSAAPVGNREIKFDYEGVRDLPGRPKAWVVTYRSSQLPGARIVQIVISPMGRVLATRPTDLDHRVEAWEKRRLPPELRD
jgi:hypothetical protein